MNDTTRQVILHLKEVKEQKGLSCQDIYFLCENNSTPVGLTTIRRFFSKGSEDKVGSFRTVTVNAIFNAVIGKEHLSGAESEALKSLIELNDKVIEEKDQIIESLQKEIYSLKLQLETTKDVFKMALEAFGKSVSDR